MDFNNITKPTLTMKQLKIRLNFLGDNYDFLQKLEKARDNSSLDNFERNMFSLMFESFRMMYNIQSAYFRVCEYTDGKYTLNVRKDLHSQVTIKFIVNTEYKGVRESF